MQVQMSASTQQYAPFLPFRHSAYMVCVLLCLLAAILPNLVLAQTIILQPGEHWQKDHTHILCAPNHTDMPETPRFPAQQPLVIEACQYWDDFDRSCLFSKRTHHVGNLVCVEECQHWDDFAKRCLFQTQCRYYHTRRVFVRTVCEKFDGFSRSCLHTQDQLIQR